VLLNADVRRIAAGLLALSVPAVSVPETAGPLPVTVHVDATRIRSIGGVSSLDRHAWFGVYHEAGYGNKVVDGKKMDEWIWEEGRMWPSRGTIGLAEFPEDPARPSFIDPAAISNFTGKLARYVTALGYDPDHKAIFSGRGHGDFPLYMCWPTNLTRGVATVSNHLAHGEAVVRIFQRMDELGGLLPKWFEVTNESDIQKNFGWHWDADAWDKLAEYHNAVADAMHTSVFSNTVKVAGPCDAWPLRDGTGGDFLQWERTNKKFVHLSGGKIDAYAFHAYEKMDTRTSYESHLGRADVWHLGRLPAFLDLWQNEQFITWSNTLPFVFSEYGMLSDPVEEGNNFWKIRSSNGILLSLLDRPDVVDKMSVFIPSFAPYDLMSPRVFFASDDGGVTYRKTSNFEYLRFWHDLQGDYLFSTVDSRHLVQHAFLDGGTNLFVVMKNNFKDPIAVDIQTVLPPGASVGTAQLQRIYNAGDDIGRDPFSPVSGLESIPVNADETVMLKIGLSGLPVLPPWNETNLYANRTLVPMQTGQPEDFILNLPVGADRSGSTGRLYIGLYSFTGFSNALQQVSVNDVHLDAIPDLFDTSGAVRYWTQISIPVPAGILQAGDNTVRIVPDQGDDLMKITGVRLAAVTPGYPIQFDQWLAEYGINDPNEDSDGDGFTAWEEYICGTHPHQPNSRLQLLPSARTGFYFASETGRVYSVEAADDLRSEWILLTSGISGTGGAVEFTDSDDVPSRFYRIRAGLQGGNE